MKTLNKSIFVLLLMTMALLSNAQIKVHSNNHISIGSLTKHYGIQVHPNGSYTCIESSADSDWGWVSMSLTSKNYSKCWIVNNPTLYPNRPNRFYVIGKGIVYKHGDCTMSDSRLQNWEDDIEDAMGTIEGITGFYYTENDNDDKEKTAQRMVGLSAEEVEKVLPEAVMRDEDGYAYLNYEALTVILIEAVKEQQKEIESLRNILDKNGLLK